MTTWEIKPRARLRPNGQLSRRTSVHEAHEPHLGWLRPESGAQPALPSPTKSIAKPAWWQLPAAFLFELVMVVLHYTLIEETMQSAGVEINKFFKDDVLIGWLFQRVPELTAREPLAAITAVFFVGLPIAVWLNLLEGPAERTGSIGEKIVRVFLLVAYLFIIIGEVLLVLHRVNLGNSNAFMVQSNHEPAIAIFFSVLFVIVNAAAAYTTASLYRGRKLSRRA